MMLALALTISLQRFHPKKIGDITWLRPCTVSIAVAGKYIAAQGGAPDEYLAYELMTPNGKHVRSLDTVGDYFVGGPTGFLYSSYEGHIVVTDQYDREVRHFGSYGTGKANFSRGGQIWWGNEKNGPQYLAVGSKGDVFAYDQGSDSIKHFDGKGKFLNSISNDLLFVHDVQGLAVDADDNVYASCVEKRGHASFVACFSAAGKVLRKIGSSGNGIGQFKIMAVPDANQGPTSITIGPDGHLYVVDVQAAVIRVYDKLGKALKSLNIGDDSMTIYAIAVDKQGTLYAATEFGLAKRKT